VYGGIGKDESALTTVEMLNGHSWQTQTTHMLRSDSYFASVPLPYPNDDVSPWVYVAIAAIVVVFILIIVALFCIYRRHSIKKLHNRDSR
jgi:hypothetical protein